MTSPFKSILPRAVALGLALVQSVAQASWQADLESGTDGAGLVWAIFAGFAYFYIRDEFRRTRFRGLVASTLVTAYLAIAYYFPVTRLLAAGLALFFLSHVIWRGIRGA